MSLGTSELAEIDELLNAESDTSPSRNARGLDGFRVRFPRLSLTRCDASDLDAETPFRVYPRLSLFLVDASDHCWRGRAGVDSCSCAVTGGKGSNRHSGNHRHDVRRLCSHSAVCTGRSEGS